MIRLTRRNLLLGVAASTVGLAGASVTTMAAGRTVAGIVFQQDQYMKTVQMGFSAASKAAGAELLDANSDNKLEKESQLIDTYIARKVDAIVLTPISKDGSMPAIKKARDAGITVVTCGTTVNGDLAQASVVSSDADLGANTGKEAHAFLEKMAKGRKVKAAVVAFRSQVPEQSDARVNGFLSQVKDQIEIVSTQEAWLAEKSIAVCSDIITANPELELIYAANEGGTVGAVQAVKKAGKEGKIFVYGIDGSEQLGNMLLDKDNVLQATTAQKPFDVGGLAIKAALAILDKKPVDKNVSVPVLGLSRDKPDDVKAYIADLKKL